MSRVDRDRVCARCIYFDADEDGLLGLCRRNPPVRDATTLLEAWPEISLDDWCGECYTEDDYRIDNWREDIR